MTFEEWWERFYVEHCETPTSFECYQTGQASARELVEKMRELADKVSKIGNGQFDGNSDGNILGQQIRAEADKFLGGDDAR